MNATEVLSSIVTDANRIASKCEELLEQISEDEKPEEPTVVTLTRCDTTVGRDGSVTYRVVTGIRAHAGGIYVHGECCVPNGTGDWYDCGWHVEQPISDVRRLCEAAGVECPAPTIPLTFADGETVEAEATKVHVVRYMPHAHTTYVAHGDDQHPIPKYVRESPDEIRKLLLTAGVAEDRIAEVIESD